MPFDSGVHGRAVVLLVPDVADPVTHKRAEAFRDAGCRVVVAGFYRGRFLDSDPPEGPHFAFGRTVDARYRHRLWALALALLRMLKAPDPLRSAGVLYARNLDQLALAIAIRVLLRSRAKIFYEVLDIQPVASGRGLGPLLTRVLERIALRQVALLVVSSPAFHSEYFKRRLSYRGRWFLLENKLAPSVHSVAHRVRIVDRLRANRGDRWVVGYFGFIRGQATLDLIVKLARRLRHKVIFRFAGSLTSVDPVSFRQAVDQNENIEFVGGYVNPKDLPRLHADVDFVWAIDLENTDGNSRWLMPCRFYEAGYFGVPCLAARQFEIGRTIAELDCGWTFSLPCEQEIVKFLETLSAADYRAKLQNLAAMPESSFVSGPAADGLGLLVAHGLSHGHVTFGDAGCLVTADGR